MRQALLVGLLATLSCATNDRTLPPLPLCLVNVHVSDYNRHDVPHAEIALNQIVLPPTDAFGNTAGRVIRGEYTLEVKALGYRSRLWTLDVEADKRIGVSLEKELTN